MQTETNSKPNTNSGPEIRLASSWSAGEAISVDTLADLFKRRPAEAPLPPCWRLTIPAATPLVELLSILMRDYGFTFRWERGEIVGRIERPERLQ